MIAPEPSRAIINLAAYRNNLDVIQKRIGTRTRLLVSVKADAYGHGLLPLAHAAAAYGVAFLGVATVAEGVALREGGITLPILVLFQCEADALPAVVDHDLTLMVSDLPTAEILGVLARKRSKEVAVHCMIDLGMGRQGFEGANALASIHHLSRISHLDLQGMATHFPDANKVGDAFTQTQIREFKALCKTCEKEGVPFEFIHAANSAGLVNYPDSHGDLVRPGIMTYGVWPSDVPDTHNTLQPVLRWECKVVQVRQLAPGASVGYGRTYQCEEASKVAILPIGYADGYRHNFSNKAEVLIRGVRCPVRGSVCMDQIVVDVSHLSLVQTGDTATLIGSDGDEMIRVEELAVGGGTIPYEILTSIGNRVHREYVE